MIVLDIGNTDTVIGQYNNDKLLLILRLTTKDIKFLLNLKKIFLKNNFIDVKKENKKCIISSVVPKVNKDIKFFLESFEYKFFFLNQKTMPKKIRFNYSANELGADRIANTFSSIEKYGKNSIIIDFGTATTFDVIKNNIYKGGTIAPGINISHSALVANASKLKKINITKIKSIVGNSTINSMKSGFYWGYISLINGIIEKILNDQKFAPKIILTGGLAKVFMNEIKFKTYYEPNLTLNGLYSIGRKVYA